MIFIETLRLVKKIKKPIAYHDHLKSLMKNKRNRCFTSNGTKILINFSIIDSGASYAKTSNTRKGFLQY